MQLLSHVALDAILEVMVPGLYPGYKCGLQTPSFLCPFPYLTRPLGYFLCICICLCKCVHFSVHLR